MRVLLLLFVLLPRLAAAQEPVAAVPDWASYGTALVNPTIAMVQALRSEHKLCHSLQLGLSELVGNGVTLGIKHFVKSERPCLGCAPNGMPSGHTMNSVLGASWSLRWGGVSAASTAVLRPAAHRHTWPQVLAGFGIGVGAELVGHLVKCDYD